MDTDKFHSSNSTDIIIGKNRQVDERAIIGYSPLRDDIDQSIRIGNNLIVLAGAIIYKGTRIGDNAIIGHNVVVREENIIGDNFKIWSNSVIDYGCNIGNNVKIHSNCYIAQFTSIEDNVFLAPGTTIGNDPHPGCDFSIECIKKANVFIKKGAQIGLNVTILPNVVIGERALVGAGAVVVDNVPAETVVTGNPARVSKSRYDLKCETGLTDNPYRRRQQ
ncbi:MAG TPA: N-acetyltransferase [Nitrospirae bacterium]|nr:N-acetyltransferase [Nitrospirota bacterium]